VLLLFCCCHAAAVVAFQIKTKKKTDTTALDLAPVVSGARKVSHIHFFF
jgi:hypothetical protein